MKTIFKYIKPQMGRMAFGFVIKFIGTITELFLPWLLSVILDEFVPAKDTKMIYFGGAMMLLCAAICLFSNTFANRMSTKTARDITRSIRSDLFKKITSLSCSQADTFTVPSLISRMTNDTYHLHQMIDRMQRLGVRSPIMLIGGIIVSFTLDPIMALVLVSTLPLLAIVVWFVSTHGIKLFTAAQKQLDRLLKRAQESMVGIRVIQALSKESYENEQFSVANHEVVRRERQASMLMNVTSPVMNLLLNFGLTFVVIVGAYRVNGAKMQPGTMIAFLSYFTLMLTALMMVSRIFMMLSKGTASGRRVAEILDAPMDMQTVDIPAVKTDNHIEFCDVTFSYDKKEPNVKDISFTLKSGETLGIIGPTGSGKSTVIWLLMRFYDTDSGCVRINGRDVRSIPADELHSMFGVALQNDFLFSGSIKENIEFFRDIDDEDMMRAIETAQAEFITQREGGLDGEIASKGLDISGGQKQRTLISRALAAKPEVLILDDSSSALDYKTDSNFRNALAKEYDDITKIIVAQRVSSIKNCTRIMMLDDGNILGYGTHDELMQSCKSYRDIAELQMGEVE